MTNAYRDYPARARELMLQPSAAIAFVVLNQHADAHGTCPSCGALVAAYEADRCTHARTCRSLLRDVAANPNSTKGGRA